MVLQRGSLSWVSTVPEGYLSVLVPSDYLLMVGVNPEAIVFCEFCWVACTDRLMCIRFN